MNTKFIALALFAAATGLFALARTNIPPSDLRDAVADRDFSIALPVIDKNNGDIPAANASAAAPADQDLYVREYTYHAAETDNRETARTAALAEIKRQLLEELGTYVRSETVVKDNTLVTDKIVSMAGGLIETKILDEKWTGGTFYLKARMKVDPETLKKIKEAAEKPAPQTAAVEEPEQEPAPVPVPGMRVYHPEWNHGKIDKVLGNGEVSVYFGWRGLYKNVNIKSLGLEMRCSQNICRDNSVVNSYYGYGRVIMLFSNGLATVKFENRSLAREIKLSELEKNQ